ncbi:MAG: urease accessory protein UreF [Pseudomonadota bacterium]
MGERRGPLLRLLHLVSPSLPTGAFAYSQGLEWAIAKGWVQDAPSLQAWLADLIHHGLARVDIPILRRMYTACLAQEESAFARWCDLLMAMRESSELRLEEQNRGRAMATLLEGLQISFSMTEKGIIERSQLAGFAMAAARWNIPLSEAAPGYAWSWLENQVLTGIKTIPLGQTQGHQILMALDPAVMTAVGQGLRLADNDIGSSSPALAVACSRHESQYTRLYRS